MKVISHFGLTRRQQPCIQIAALVFHISTLQLTLPADTFHQSPPVTETHFPASHASHKPYLLPPIFRLSSPPHLRHQFITRPDRTRKPCRELLDIRRVTTAKVLQQCVGRCVPAEEPMHDRATEAHLLAGFGRRVERVVVAIQSVRRRQHAPFRVGKAIYLYKRAAS